jgi:tetraacyldisaccharide 4'-kinase
VKNYLYNLATDKKEGTIAALFKAVLLILSFIYGLLIRGLVFIRRSRQRRLNCKVISVGNITLGGTGKTCLAEYIALYLKSKGHKVAILSRGYGRRNTHDAIRNTNYEDMGDEPYMLSKKLGEIPVIVDKDRARAANTALREYGADTVILDDGFQQWQIKKDLEIVVIDALHPFGNKHMLPRGILREPLSSLRRADIIVITKTNFNPAVENLKLFLRRINLRVQIFEALHTPVGFYRLDNPDKLLAIDAFKAKKAALFCGIGDPDSFEKLVRTLGVSPGLFFKFADHYDYTRKDLEKIFRRSQEKKIDTIITTEKDAARLLEFSLGNLTVPIFVLSIKLDILRYEDKFHHRLLSLYPR